MHCPPGGWSSRPRRKATGAPPSQHSVQSASQSSPVRRGTVCEGQSPILGTCKPCCACVPLKSILKYNHLLKKQKNMPSRVEQDIRFSPASQTSFSKKTEFYCRWRCWPSGQHLPVPLPQVKGDCTGLRFENSEALRWRCYCFLLCIWKYL